jgi:hypothetical protein
MEVSKKGKAELPKYIAFSLSGYSLVKRNLKRWMCVKVVQWLL